MSIRIRPFGEWREMKLRTVVDVDEGSHELIVECGTCGGCGEVEDVGVKTGRYFDTDCPTCDGEGKVEVSRQTAEDVVYTKVDYEEEVKLDLMLLSDWTRKPYHQLLSEAGFSVWSEIDTKRLMASLANGSPRVA